MPRQSRLELPGSLHHVMARGIDKQKIFIDKRDLLHFRDRLGRVIAQSGNDCFAWSLMKNHFHLLLRSGDEPLSRMMRRLLTGHAVYFNRRHKRSGHLFQNRFKSILCQEDTYFLRLVRYIHLNPIRAGEVKTIKTLNSYPFTGHAYIMGNLENDWQDTHYPLRWFGRRKQRSKEDYLTFLKEGRAKEKREELTGGGLLRTVGGWKKLEELKERGESAVGDERMLGDSDFVQTVWKRADGEGKNSKTPAERQTSLERLVRYACQYGEVDCFDVRSASKYKLIQRVKSMICFVAIRMHNRSGVEVATYLNISKSSVSRLLSSFQNNKDFQKFVKTYDL